MHKFPLRAVIVGGGQRADIYAELALKKPEKLKIVGLVEPSPRRTAYLKNKYQIPEENCFCSVEELCEREKIGDLVINGTMDQLHVPTAIPTLEKGYDLLLEKPLAVSTEEMKALYETAKKTERHVYLCHVLRYTEFYSTIKKILLDGEIGRPISLAMSEHISYGHMGAAFVRGKWRSQSTCFAPLLLAKSCHDLDIMTWLMEPYRPTAVSSFGSNLQFTKENKPKNAPHRCYDGCEHLESCPYSAKSNYAEHDAWSVYVFDALADEGGLSFEEKEKALKTDNPFGICAWDFDREGNADHQTVNVCFEGGATATFSLIGGTARAQRSLHLVGTAGEIFGVFEDNRITVRKIAPHNEKWFEERVIKTRAPEDGHAGGDLALIEDFADILNGTAPDFRACDLDSATDAYRIAFAAETSKNEGRTVSLV